MPELPEVETIIRGLQDDLVGRAFQSVTVHWTREVGTPDPVSFARRLKGQRVASLTRRGKYIVFNLTSDTLLIHLKMSGRLYLAAKSTTMPDDRWVRVRFVLDDDRELRFADPRKFGRVYLVRDMEEVIGKLGPEPLSEELTAEMFAELVRKRHGIIKPLLLNQQFLAGVGNIYADEALWLARIDPRRRADSLRPDEADGLFRAIREVLENGINYGGASVRMYRKADGTKGESQEHFNVYDREGQPCPRQCGALISKIWLAQRGTHFCEKCQK